MPDTIVSSKKPETPVGPEKAATDSGELVEGEVHGDGFYRWVYCWNCGEQRRVLWEYSGEVFICGNCGVEYVPNDP
jgi:hypothetical protein